jgi:anti-sigma factor RsiW
MDCREFVELVTALLDGALDPADEDRFVAHLSRCDGCDTYLAQFRRTVDALGTLPAPPLDADVRTRLLDAFRRSA